MFCSKCKNSAIIFRSYSKMHLCERHFREMFEKRFRATVREFSMVRKNERVAVALSGGKDSCVLLHLLAMLRKVLPFELVAIAIDEGISGYRTNSLGVARRETKKLGVPLHVFSFKKETGKSLDQIMKKKNSSIPCSYCGVLRRRLLNTASRKLGANRIAFGHNLDDMAQTILMNIMRNEPMRLARLHEPFLQDEKFVQRIRPLMRTPEKEIAVYAMINGVEIDFQECPYARHAFRAHVRSQLNESEENYPGTKFRILNSFLAMEKFLKKGMEAEQVKISYCKECGEPGANAICMFCGMLEGF